MPDLELGPGHRRTGQISINCAHVSPRTEYLKWQICHLRFKVPPNSNTMNRPSILLNMNVLITGVINFLNMCHLSSGLPVTPPLWAMYPHLYKRISLFTYKFNNPFQNSGRFLSENRLFLKMIRLPTNYLLSIPLSPDWG